MTPKQDIIDAVDDVKTEVEGHKTKREDQAIIINTVINYYTLETLLDIRDLIATKF